MYQHIVFTIFPNTTRVNRHVCPVLMLKPMNFKDRSLGSFFCNYRVAENPYSTLFMIFHLSNC